MKTQVRFLGTATVVPEAGHDTASFLIDDRILVDTGWYAPIKMKSYGVSPMDLEYVFLTHGHHDHYLGLPQIFFHLRMRHRTRSDRPLLKVVGPAADIERVVHLARMFLQVDRFPEVDYAPEIIPLTPGERYEDARFHLETCATRHPVQGLCYRYHDKLTGATISFTGDTAYSPEIADHVHGSDLLIHEASHGPKEIGESSSSGHAGAPDAARIAQMAQVRRLALIHCPEDQRATALAAARQIFANTFFPQDGEMISVVRTER